MSASAAVNPIPLQKTTHPRPLPPSGIANGDPNPISTGSATFPSIPPQAMVALKAFNALKRKADAAQLDGSSAGESNGGTSDQNGGHAHEGNGNRETSGKDGAAKTLEVNDGGSREGRNKAWLVGEVDTMEKAFKDACIAKAHIIRFQGDIRAQNLSHIYPHTPRYLLDRFHRSCGEWRAARGRIEGYLVEADRLETIRTNERIERGMAEQAALEEAAAAAQANFAAGASGRPIPENSEVDAAEKGGSGADNGAADGEVLDIVMSNGVARIDAPGVYDLEGDPTIPALTNEPDPHAGPQQRPKPRARIRAPVPAGQVASDDYDMTALPQVVLAPLVHAGLPAGFTLSLPVTRSNSRANSTTGPIDNTEVEPLNGAQGNDPAAMPSILSQTYGTHGFNHSNAQSSGANSIAEGMDFMQYLNSGSNMASPIEMRDIANGDHVEGIRFQVGTSGMLKHLPGVQTIGVTRGAGAGPAGRSADIAPKQYQSHQAPILVNENADSSDPAVGMTMDSNDLNPGEAGGGEGGTGEGEGLNHLSSEDIMRMLAQWDSGEMGGTDMGPGSGIADGGGGMGGTGMPITTGQEENGGMPNGQAFVPDMGSFGQGGYPEGAIGGGGSFGKAKEALTGAPKAGANQTEQELYNLLSFVADANAANMHDGALSGLGNGAGEGTAFDQVAHREAARDQFVQELRAGDGNGMLEVTAPVGLDLPTDLGIGFQGAPRAEERAVQTSRIDRVYEEMPLPGDGGLGPAMKHDGVGHLGGIVGVADGEGVAAGMGGIALPADFDISQFSEQLSGFPELDTPDGGGDVGGGQGMLHYPGSGPAVGFEGSREQIGAAGAGQGSANEMMDFSSYEGFGEGMGADMGESGMSEEDILRMLAGLEQSTEQ